MLRQVNYKLMKKMMTGMIVLSTLTGCIGSREVECDVPENHIHLYVDEDTKLSRYIPGEKQSTGNFHRTNQYIKETDQVKLIYKNDLCKVQDNEYYLKQIMNSHISKREIWDREYVNGFYYGYGLITGWYYDYNKDDYVYGLHYGYGQLCGWHYEDRWIEISFDDETTKKIKDTTYEFKFYKLKEDGTLESKMFQSVEELEEGYDYFKSDDLVYTYTKYAHGTGKVKTKSK